MCAAGGDKGVESAQGGPHQDRLGFLQSSQEKGGEPVLPLLWLWPHVGGLPRARPQQVLLDMRRGEASCRFLHREAEVLPVCRKKGKAPE